MNGPIAQLVALTCHANAFLRHIASSAGFFPGNSTCVFCDRISFVEIKKSWLGKPGESAVAATPDQWFKYLATKRALGVRLIHQVQNDPGISDRMSAGFVGGGGEWMLGVRCPATTDYWMARWEVWNQDAPQQRIWRVTYGLVARDRGPRMVDTHHLDTLAAFKAALARIHAFSLRHDCGGFTECFDRAMQSLSELRPAHGYHKDLYVPATVSDSGQAMLDAAQSAWVFGGMGSWNDLGFDGDDGKEYEGASEQLFTAINAAICVAANESDGV